MGSAVPFRFTGLLCLLTFLSACFAPQARASGPDESLMDVTALAQMETSVAAADPRDRCFLYTKLLHDWTELAGHDLAAGDESAAEIAMQHADANAARLKVAIAKDSKRLKNAEQLLEHSAHRLTDMLRVASMDQHDAMQTVLRHVNSVHDDLLAAVFAH